MIYITGDTHGEEKRFACLPGEAAWTSEDYLLICGDFGYIFLDTEEEQDFLDQLEEKPYTICFCDGNHENFDRLYRYPEEIWHGGKIHRIRKNIIHLMRGQIFEICGKTVFAMGGASSVDRDGRIEGYSWWPQELPTSEEYHTAAQNLERKGFRVDLILTHTAPAEAIRRMGYNPETRVKDDPSDPYVRHGVYSCTANDQELVGFLEWVMYETEYDQWFFGHWHEDRPLPDYRMRALLFDVVPVE